MVTERRAADFKSIYLATRDDLMELVRGLDPASLSRTCEACPEWSIQDVVAHHIHYLGAYLTNTTPDALWHRQLDETEQARAAAAVEADAWTQAGVEARRGRTIEELFEEWRSTASQVSPTDSPFATNLYMHLSDIRETLGDESGRDEPVALYALEGYFHAVVLPRLEREGLPVNVLCADTGKRIDVAADAPVISGPTYELLLSIGGRRTRPGADNALDWGDTDQTTRQLSASYGWPGTN